MTHEVNNPNIAIRDIVDLLQPQYAIITGGKTREGCPLITFPDKGNFHYLNDLDYQKLMLYITSVPTLDEADRGFHLIIDRRNDKWSSIKSALMKISAFFPGLVHVAYILQPSGILQKAIYDVSNKLFPEDFKFHVIFLSDAIELQDFIDCEQLTEEFNGKLTYHHEVWILNRTNLEKFSLMTQNVSFALDSFTNRLAEIEFPNDVHATIILISQQQSKYNELKNDIKMAGHHGDTLLDNIRQYTGHCTADRLGNVAAIERLLVQLEETERTFDEFWSHQSSRLKHCLDLRQFEQDFKELQGNLDQHMKNIEEMTEMGETQSRIDHLLLDVTTLQKISKRDIDRAHEVMTAGKDLLSSRHPCPTEVIEPKCFELERVCTLIKHKLQRRLHALIKCRELMDHIDKANSWCTQGMGLLAMNNDTMSNLQLFQELQSLLQSANEFHCPKSIFEDSIMPETKALVTQVLQRIDDVSSMCEKRMITLKQATVKLDKPIQAVTPEPAKPLLSIPSLIKSQRFLKKANTIAKIEVDEVEFNDISGPENKLRDIDIMQHKIGHVLTELLNSERIYVNELDSIIKGYKMEMSNEAMVHLVPPLLADKENLLFGNLEDIYIFHGNTFLKDLENCISNMELVALCFVQNKDIFHKLYSYYCLNIPQSEKLREKIQNQPQFFITCQQKLGHKLPLAAYLLKPVQRITKYQLLIKDLLKYNKVLSCYSKLQEALDCMLVVLKCVNDNMHQNAIIGFTGDLNCQGKLLLQGSFSVLSSSRRERLLRLKPSSRQIFLYEKAMIFCKHNKDQPLAKATYHFKRLLKTSQIGLTETVKGDSRRFEIWLQGRAEVHTIQASSLDVKQTWVRQINIVLMSQLTELKGKQDCARFKKFDHKHFQRTPLWNAQHNISKSLDTLSISSNTMVSSNTDNSYAIDIDDIGWNSENSNTDDEEATSRTLESSSKTKYIALADYSAMGPSEVTMREGDILELLKVGCAGWWFVKIIGTDIEGWAPASYLEYIIGKV